MGSINIKVSPTVIPPSLPTIKTDINLHDAANLNHHIWRTDGSPQVPQDQTLSTRQPIWELMKLGLAFTWGLCGEQIFPVSSVHEGASFSLLTIPQGYHSQFQPEDSACTGHTCAGFSPSPDSTLRITAWVESWDLTDALHTTSPFPLLSQPPFPAAWQHRLTAINMDSSRVAEGRLNKHRGKETKKKENQSLHKVAYYPQEQEIIYRQFVPHFGFYCGGELFVFQKDLVRGLFTYILKVMRMWQNALNWFDNRHLFSCLMSFCLFKHFWFFFIQCCTKRKIIIQNKCKMVLFIYLFFFLQMSERLMACGENFFVPNKLQ